MRSVSYGRSNIAMPKLSYIALLTDALLHALFALRTRMPCQLTPLKLMPIPVDEEIPSVSFDSLRLSVISTVAFHGDPVPGV